MAQTVGTQGLGALGGLAVYVGVVILGLAIHVGLVYQVVGRVRGEGPALDLLEDRPLAVAYAAGASSSLATLPVTLRSLKAMGVSDSSARMSACVATNLNNDGILLYEAMAALIVAQAFGISARLGQQLMIAATCVLASVGIAGVPEAGLISLVGRPRQRESPARSLAFAALGRLDPGPLPGHDQRRRRCRGSRGARPLRGTAGSGRRPATTEPIGRDR